MKEDMEKEKTGNDVSAAESQPYAKSRRRTAWTYVLVGLSVFVLSFGGGILGARSYNRNTEAAVEQRASMTDSANLVSTIAKQVGESVVSVNVTSRASSASPYDALFGLGGGSRAQESAGTGIILTADGLILTNRHVVPTGATEVSITLSDGVVLDDVSVIGRTSSSDSLDIAFLKVKNLKGHTLKPAKIGDSSKMQVGDSVVAIGNTLGQFQNTVTSGIISGYGRSVQARGGGGSSAENLDGLFQTDAAINEGNSGGPLVNMSGEVIGVNTAIASGSQNVGFAIPINDVKGLIDSVKATGKLERPYLGVMYVILTDDIAKQFDLKTSRGAFVPLASDMGSATVIPGGPADKAGVEEGDIITKIDGTSIDEKHSLPSVLGQRKPGDKVVLTILRGSDTKTITAILGSAPTN